MRVLEPANLALRLILELLAVGFVAYWGTQAVDGAARWLLALAAPAVLVAVWLLFVSPRARIALAHPVRFAIELAVWAVAAAALAAAGRPWLALVFLVVAVASGTLNYLHSRERERPVEPV